ncbi:MAG: hypothetical protein JXA67_05000 [Micromonosporaceae bacterium]|nr:hypothetical protein [Micromonosporaceae bacterium]
MMVEPEPDEEFGRSLLHPLVREATTPPRLSIERAIADGRRRLRRRRIAGGAAVAGVTAVVLLSAATVWAWDRDRSAPGNPVSAASQGQVGQSAEIAPSQAQAGAAPERCAVEILPVPKGRKMSLVTAGDGQARFLAGRLYDDTDLHSVIWDNGTAIEFDIPGEEQQVEDISGKGVAVASSLVDLVPTAWVYIDGQLSRLPGGVGGTPEGINDDGVIVGTTRSGRTSRPVKWTSLESPPVELPLPDGAAGGTTTDIDEDGTIVGSVIFAIDDASDRTKEVPFLWLPDGSMRAVSPPARAGIGSLTGAVRQIRRGWVSVDTAVETGASEDGPRQDGTGEASGVRTVIWNLTTGSPTVVENRTVMTINRNGWYAGTTPDDLAIHHAGGRELTLPDLAGHPGLVNSLPYVMSDDGRIVAGQSDDQDDVIRAVVWRCS